MFDKKRRVHLPVSTAYFVEQVHDRCIDTVNREIYIHGIDMNTDSYEGCEPGVEYMMATKAIKNLHILRKQSKDAPVTIHLHTCGGMYEEGMAIYDTIMAMPYYVTIISYTHARSMSSIILQAGDNRILMPNSYFLFHLGTLGVDGESRTVHSIVDFVKGQTKTMLDIYIEHVRYGAKFVGKSDAHIRRVLKKSMEKKGDVFLTPEEAIDWGFADEILTDWPT